MAPCAAGGPASTTGRVLTQTVLFADIRGFTKIAERLSARDVAELLSRFLDKACAPIVRERGRVMKIMGDGLMALFGQDCPEHGAAHAAAALRAGNRLIAVAREFRTWLDVRFDLRGLPPFDVGVGIHTGPVMLFRLSAGGSGDLTAVGDTVNVAARLEVMSKDLGWPLVASVATITLAGASGRMLETRDLALAGREGQIAVGRLRNPPGRMPSAARKRPLAVEARDMPQPVAGYRLLAKLGEGERSWVFLAEERASRRKVVLEMPKAERARRAAITASRPADSS